MAAQVVADQPVPLQRRADALAFPVQVTAQQAVDEQDGRAVRVAGFLYRQGTMRYQLPVPAALSLLLAICSYDSTHDSVREARTLGTVASVDAALGISVPVSQQLPRHRLNISFGGLVAMKLGSGCQVSHALI